MLYMCMPYHIYDINKTVKAEVKGNYPKVLTKVNNNIYKIKTDTKINIKPKQFKMKGNYNKGLKYYNRYIFRKSKVKSTEFLSILNIKNKTQLDLYFENPKMIVLKLNKLGYKNVSKGIEEIEKKHKLGDLYNFFKGVLNGKIPASCG